MMMMMKVMMMMMMMVMVMVNYFQTGILNSANLLCSTRAFLQSVTLKRKFAIAVEKVQVRANLSFVVIASNERTKKLRFCSDF